MRIQVLLTLACAFALQCATVAAEEPYKFIQEILRPFLDSTDHKAVDVELAPAIEWHVIK